MRRHVLKVIGQNTSSDALLMVGDRPISRQKVSPVPLIHFPTKSAEDIGIFKQRSRTEDENSGLAQRIGRSATYNVLMVFAIGYTFFADDIRIIALPNTSDVYIDSTLIAVVLLFSLDIGIQVRTNDSYVWSLYFFMDILATVSILGDVQSLMSTTIPSCLITHLNQQKALGKAARLGGNCLRLLRLIKVREIAKAERLELIRGEAQSPLSVVADQGSMVVPQASHLLPIPALHSTKEVELPHQINRQSTDTPTQRRSQKKSGTLGRLYHMQNAPKASLKTLVKNSGKVRESNISKRMSHRIVTFVALIVLAICLVYPWVTDTSAFNFGNPSQYEYGLGLLNAAKGEVRFSDMVGEFIKQSTNPKNLQQIVELNITDFVAWGNVTGDMRNTELCRIQIEDSSVIIFSRRTAYLSAIFNICRTVIMCVFMTSVVIYLNADIANLVLFPLERMMETVTSLSQNPLNMFKPTPKPVKKNSCFLAKKDYARSEIKVLENAFRKIGLMLALVYGSAGSEMITSCIRYEGEFTPMVRGKEILAIFCFAKIANFDDLLEVLGVSILKYVNQISCLVHSQSEKYMGSVNKNLGDSYLLAWKFPEEEGVYIQKKLLLNAHSETVKQTTSLALMFAIKSISKITRSQALLSYQQNEKVLKHLKTFSSKLTFGFHLGWAYEGPIGSYFKIDASYLSPNVNTASRIESATKQYGVQILCSEELYLRLESRVQPFLRHIDTVTLKGVASSIKLYSFDCCTVGLTVSHAKPTKRKVDKKRKRLQEAIDSQAIQVHSLFTESAEIAEMRKSYSECFFDSYAEALNLYLEGHWREAKEIFKSQCLSAVPLDGPSHNIIEFIEEHNSVPPISWSGVRELLHK